MQITPIPKPQRIRNKKLYNSYTRDFCEWCGAWKTTRLERHHIVKRSQFGGDEHENLIMLCIVCHGKADRYEISKEELRRAKGVGMGAQ